MTTKLITGTGLQLLRRYDKKAESYKAQLLDDVMFLTRVVFSYDLHFGFVQSRILASCTSTTSFCLIPLVFRLTSSKLQFFFLKKKKESSSKLG